jgi:uncharacterized protein (TIGR00159 family)
MLVPITFLDILDIFLVAFILYQVFKLIRGTSAFSIFLVVFSLYLFWLLVKALDMSLTSALMGQVMGVGVIALLIVFQQEIRRFLLVLGNRYIRNSRFTLKRFFRATQTEKNVSEVAEQIVEAAESMSDAKIGALIVIGRMTRMSLYAENGEIINAKVTANLLETIFFKNTPLHDGAVLIEDGKIYAARCPLPVTDQINLSPKMGMRHRAALGMSEHSDALIVIVSEETGKISVADNGILREDLSIKQLRNILLTEKVW